MLSRPPGESVSVELRGSKTALRRPYSEDRNVSQEGVRSTACFPHLHPEWILIDGDSFAVCEDGEVGSGKCRWITSRKQWRLRKEEEWKSAECFTRPRAGRLHTSGPRITNEATCLHDAPQGKVRTAPRKAGCVCCTDEVLTRNLHHVEV